MAHQLQGDYVGAVGYFRGVLVHEPENGEAMARLGSCLFDMGYLFEALYWFWRCVKKNPKSPMVNTNYGIALGALGHHEEAIPYLTKAAALGHKLKDASPDMLGLVYNNLGNAFERMGQMKEAVGALRRCLQYRPNDPFPHSNLGICLRKSNLYQEALDELNTAERLEGEPRPESMSRVNIHDLHYNRGLCKLIMGDLKGGFEDYESRLLTTENKQPNFGLPAEKKWCFDDLNGKTIVVWCEQGFGDTMQFARFLPALVALGARVQIVAQTSLRNYITIPGVEVLPGGTKLEDYDYWVALMSLPLMFGVTREDEIPEPYFPDIPEARLDAAAKWLDTLRVGPDGQKKTLVGVCWSGNFRHKNDAQRSIPFKEMSRLFNVPGHVFISLQQVRPEDVAAVDAIGDKLLHPKIKDWHDTAALTVLLDKVITVDTAVAHLAGSLGTPTWTLIPDFCTDWRWGLPPRESTPWYPSMTLWRQDGQNWNKCVSRVRSQLEGEAAQAP